MLRLSVVLLSLSAICGLAYEKGIPAYDEYRINADLEVMLANYKVPPPPGPAGDATVQGIDSDRNQLRDDVQIATFEYFAETPAKRLAIEEVARALELAITAGESLDVKRAIKSASGLTLSIQCASEASSISPLEIKLIESLVMNTSERRAAYRNFNRIISDRHFGRNQYSPTCTARAQYAR
jgi:hypothetical protein